MARRAGGRGRERERESRRGDTRGDPLYVAHRRCLAFVRCRSLARRVTLKLPPSSLGTSLFPPSLSPLNVGSSRPFPSTLSPRTPLGHHGRPLALCSSPPVSPLAPRRRSPSRARLLPRAPPRRVVRFSLATRCPSAPVPRFSPRHLSCRDYPRRRSPLCRTPAPPFPPRCCSLSGHRATSCARPMATALCHPIYARTHTYTYAIQGKDVRTCDRERERRVIMLMTFESKVK